VVDLAGALIRANNMVKPARVADKPIKGLYVSREFGYLLGDKDQS